MSYFLNIENDSTNQWPTLYKKDKSETKTAASDTITIPLTPTQTPKTDAKLTNAGNIPLTSAKPEQQTGLMVEKQTTSGKEPKETGIDKRNVPTGKDHGPNLETQAKKWFNMSDEKWNKLTEQQKQDKRNTAMLGMIEARNKDRKARGLKDDGFGVAEQYEKYMGRVQNTNDVEGLTHTVPAMKKDDQLKAFDKSFRYEDKSYKNVAERVLSNDYTKLHPDNVVGAAKIITKNFSEENQVIAAQNTSKADVSLHKDLVNTFLEQKNEKIDFALSEQIGKFGVTYDKNGNIVKTDKAIQLDCFKTITNEANIEHFQSVIENAAKNIYTMDKANQSPAVNFVVSTGNEGAIKVAASQYSKYDKSAQNDIASAINDSHYDSAKEALAGAQQTQSETEASKNVSASNNTNTTESKNTTSENKVISEIKTILDSNIVQNKTAKISDAIKNASDSEKLALLNEYSTNLDVIKAIWGSNPSSKVVSKIIELLNDNKFNNKNIDELIGAIADSGIFKGENSKRIAMLSPAIQLSLIKNLPLSDLKSINVNYLSSTAKDKFEKRIKELNKQESVSTGNQKFGLFGFGVKRTA